MRNPIPPGFGAAGLRRLHGSRRPIASGLNLSCEHIDKIDQSHERCAALGVSRIERPDLSVIGRSDLARVRDRNRRLHEHAAPVMEMLHEQIVNTESMVVLTDAAGTILHSIGDDDFLGRAAKVALAPGANWSEAAKGTNAVGTALVSETPTLVHADEHYLHANHFLTCSAAPILDPRGNILGVLDVSGDHRSYHQHTMALVKMSARMIENHWLTDDYRHVMRLHFHRRVEYIGTLMEGILAIGPDGRIVGANRGALEQLAVGGAALRKHTLTSLFGTTVGALVDRFRSPLATPMPVTAHGGQPFHLHARFNWPVWTSLAEAVSAPSVSPAVGESEPAPAPGMSSRASDHAEGGLSGLLTGDAQVAGAIEKIRRVMARDIPILILGEHGTGKALLARAIHEESARARQPFVAVNCASVPPALIEAELLGCEGGPFSGARRTGQVGKIVQANGGTLFLEAIGELPTGLQAQLLHVLRERRVTPLNSDRSIPVDVSIICSTHEQLQPLIDRRQFREDLFYRLNGLAVRLPALRERTDLMTLVARILDREAPGRSLRLDDEVQPLFEHYHWPGNVRQLFNVLRTAALMATDGARIACKHLSDDFLEDARAHLGAHTSGRCDEPSPVEPSAPIPPAPASGRQAHSADPRSLQQLEIEAIRQAVQDCGGNITEAAKRLAVSRNTIYRKLRWNRAA